MYIYFGAHTHTFSINGGGNDSEDDDDDGSSGGGDKNTLNIAAHTHKIGMLYTIHR